MIKQTFLLLVLAFITIPIITHATPPTEIIAKYEFERQELNIIVQHLVNNPTEHFINEVDIYKNGREVEKKTFNFQTSHRNQTITPFKITAVHGDKFRIVAISNKKGGSFEKTIQVKADQ